MSDIEFHPYASIFPALEQDQVAELKADIAAHGVRMPITRFGSLDGPILDGRNRALACESLGIPCPSAVFMGTDADAFQRQSC